MNIGLDMDITIKCFGEYSYQIANPVLFYTNVCGNVEQDYTRDEIDGQLKSELMTACSRLLQDLRDGDPLQCTSGTYTGTFGCVK